MVTCAEEERDDTEGEDAKKVDVRVTQLRARISPQFEVVLPSGDLYEHFITNFNNLELTFNLHFSVIGNTLGGFESIRGYETDSLNAFRFCLLSSNIEREFLRGRELKIKLSE
ncbi:MAG: hypothetical protein ACUVWJ_12365 [Spirochaetota bacterium]